MQRWTEEWKHKNKSIVAVPKSDQSRERHKKQDKIQINSLTVEIVCSHTSTYLEPHPLLDRWGET